MYRLILMCLLVAAPVQADIAVATRTIRARTILTPEDVTLKPGTLPGVYSDTAQLLGLETRVAVYAGRPIRPGDVGPPALVDRNQIVPLLFQSGGLSIQAEGRALSRGGEGDQIRVINLTSRTQITGQIMPDGTVQVLQ
ncbi:flagellar basal body P-ring formation chaperone FlgA [Thalassovita taeanensis]|uniref:Flagella basal body P-ring formation protein FlgA n=1 Tax=Thalassovita taeanensis TaxID=657014 RepID=A0A1H9I8C7_9RHOB|nr:flagellar basal body P-ring formation chaperone FlgA [Thalassovita taeanensis]SEQ70806.1 flagella basal body P-ring formation protein FlgA [Thalassovita taeanensis]